jgi:ATP-dependent helicase/nuclease subunit B
MDDMTTREVAWDRLDGLAPPEHDDYWQKTLEFLKIARDYWPAELADRDKIDPAARRDLLIEAERKRLETHHGPVIAAGSTGSMPATASLLATIAKLPHGAVVLPGLDTDLDDESWDMIGEIKDGVRVVQAPSFGHPQLAMHGLLRRIRIAREEVVALGPSGAREKLTSEALRPPDATEHWAARLDDLTRETALAGVTVIEAANAEDEALAITIALREAVRENKTAALVTPDRALARRVAAALMRWNIEADDSGGDRLPDTEAGVFARLVAQAALNGLEPVTLLALLKHARFRLGAHVGAHSRAIAALELAVLRGPRPRAGTQGLAHALATFRATRGSLHGSDPRRLIVAGDLDAAEALVVRLSAAVAPLEAVRGAQSFTALAVLHAEALRVLSGDGAGAEMAFANDDGAGLARAFEAIAEQSIELRAAPGDYADLFEATISDRVCRRAGRPGARVRILGTIEARLVHVDRVVLGGLVEGVWPPDAPTDPWLSRPMRLELGLDLPERRIGLSAHDFAQLLGMHEVFLTRATKVRGAPTVASRFTQRLAAVAGETWKDALARGEKYLHWMRDLDRAETVKPVARPRPRPTLDARPKQLSVTEIEHWLRDPYTIYAKHVLKLRPLDAVDTPPGARDRGTVIHGAIGDFTEKYAKDLPPNPLGALIALGEQHFGPLADYPEARAFWWPRFLRIARWFIAWEAQRRANASALHAEVKGELKIQIDKWIFKLTTRADRIEQLADGSFAILDYKTGSTPTEPQVRTGLSPQLTLEGAILQQGGFKGVAPGSLSEFAYVSLRGREPAGEEKPIAFKEGTPDFHADRALVRLRGVVERFADVKTPYRSLVSPMWKARYGDYDHLARVAEWSAGGEDEEGEA